MARLRISLALLALLLLPGCSAQLQSPQASDSVIEQQRKQQGEQAPMPTFMYRPGGGLTISGGSEI
ncbi:MAG: hypothetical protein ACREQA_05055 [Candidatus Binatia bacterium]